jgi:AcrR family transcriptional regulator
MANSAPDPTRDKAKKLDSVAASIARLLVQHGPESVTHARVARAANVSRAWLYKYLGSTRPDLIHFATVHFGNLLAEFDARPRTSSRAEWMCDTVAGMRDLIEKSARHPWVLPLYFRYLGTDGELGRTIAELEKAYIETTASEVAAVFGLEREAARWVAELLFCARMTLVHRHQLGGVLAPPKLDELARFLGRP